MTTIRDAWTVTRKELAEVFGDPLARRGAVIQSLLLVIGLGILVPRTTAPLWLAGRPEAILLFLMLPSIVAGSISADAFAGERERRTLETLLATPLSDASIVFGKAAAAILSAFTTGLCALLLAIVTVNVKVHPPGVFVPSAAIWAGVLIGSFASSCFTTAIAIAMSLRIPVARSVQQMASLMFVLPVLVVGTLSEQFGFSFTWPHVFELIGGGLAVGLGALALAARRFHRDRLFVKR
ncbi:MAG TPA: ABC transporter permease subunit [Kofleriaceae bacterium]|nr:ABC transporter permease subunit [Kofleriaceae bacterium]